MKVLLTGGSGFVGRVLLRALVARSWAVRTLVRTSSRLQVPPGKESLVDIWPGSLVDPDSLRGIGEGVDAVVHLAGAVAPRHLRDFDRVNRLGSAHLAEACRGVPGLERWVQLSSLAATGPGDPVRDGEPPHPISRYGRSKLAGEREVAARGFSGLIVLRPPAVYGPGDPAFAPMIRALVRGLPVPLPRPGPAHLSLLHVEDLAGALVAALEAPGAAFGRIFHVSGPERPSPAELMERIAALAGRRARLLPVPLPLAWTLAGVCSPVRRLCGFPRYLNLDKIHELGASAWSCESPAAEELLSWEARIPLSEGLAREVARAKSGFPLDGAARRG